MTSVTETAARGGLGSSRRHLHEPSISPWIKRTHFSSSLFVHTHFCKHLSVNFGHYADCSRVDEHKNKFGLSTRRGLWWSLIRFLNIEASGEYNGIINVLLLNITEARIEFLPTNRTSRFNALCVQNDPKIGVPTHKLQPPIPIEGHLTFKFSSWDI